MRIAAVLGLVAVLLYGSGTAHYGARTEVQAFAAEMAAKHGFDEQQLIALFNEAEKKQSILDAIARPAEKAKPWWEYRDIFIQDSRIEQGVEFWNANESALAQAESTYGVPAAYIVAIIGVETRYGRHKGGYRVLDALSTLAFDYPPRSAFFRKELEEFLVLAQEESKAPEALYGSYAGAMGFGQFIPSSYRAYAVDFDGDGVRDIWENSTDAIGSVANYFARHGWRPGAEVVRRVTLDAGDADTLANASLSLKHTVGALRKRGVIVTGIDDAEDAALFRMALRDGEEYWLGLNNFYVITRYNRSRLYALAVHQLAEAVAAARQGASQEHVNAAG